jgi:hypothetical protein
MKRTLVEFKPSNHVDVYVDVLDSMTKPDVDKLKRKDQKRVLVSHGDAAVCGACPSCWFGC